MPELIFLTVVVALVGSNLITRRLLADAEFRDLPTMLNDN